MSERPGKDEHLKGLTLSEGAAVGRVCLLSQRRHIGVPRYEVCGRGFEQEVSRLDGALTVVAERLESIRERVGDEIGKAEAEIFVAQRMIVEDAKLRGEVIDCIRDRGLNAEAAVAETMDRYEQRLAALADGYLSERASDLGEVKRRVLNVLADTTLTLRCENEEHCQSGRGRVVVAEELTPSVTVDLSTEQVLGFATEYGGINSHAAILARALGIPAVSGLRDICSQVSCGTEILIDGASGEIVIWPRSRTVAAAVARNASALRLPDPVEPVPGFEVLANVSVVSDLQQALDLRAEGIGLYRTEIEVMAAGRLLDEDTLAQCYSGAVRSMNGKRVVFRMFDVGSDKALPGLEMPKEDNPALGRRGARFLIERSDLLRTQARALARASAHGPVHVMYPMVVGIGQFLKLRRLFAEAVADLPSGEILHGAMLEVPSACFQASEILEEADFVSIGTNDLIQYFFAVDRNNALVAPDCDFDQRVFWDLLRSVVGAARSAGKHLSVCGELAGDPKFTPHLMDLNVTCVSVSPRRIGSIRQAAQRHLAASAV